MYYRLELVHYIITVHSYFIFILQVYTLRRSRKTATQRNWHHQVFIMFLFVSI